MTWHSCTCARWSCRGQRASASSPPARRCGCATWASASPRCSGPWDTPRPRASCPPGSSASRRGATRSPRPSFPRCAAAAAPHPPPQGPRPPGPASPRMRAAARAVAQLQRGGGGAGAGRPVPHHGRHARGHGARAHPPRHRRAQGRLRAQGLEAEHPAFTEHGDNSAPTRPPLHPEAICPYPMRQSHLLGGPPSKAWSMRRKLVRASLYRVPAPRCDSPLSRTARTASWYSHRRSSDIVLVSSFSFSSIVGRTSGRYCGSKSTTFCEFLASTIKHKALSSLAAVNCCENVHLQFPFGYFVSPHFAQALATRLSRNSLRVIYLCFVISGR